jgi:hypothetical protein
VKAVLILPVAGAPAMERALAAPVLPMVIAGLACPAVAALPRVRRGHASVDVQHVPGALA